MNRRQFNKLLAGTAAFTVIPLKGKETTPLVGRPFPQVNNLILRIVGETAAKQIICEKVQPGNIEGDYFEIDQKAGKLLLRGNTPLAVAGALNNWLREEAHSQISWTGDNLNIPETLPLPKEKRMGNASLPYRAAYNFCTFGYTSPWWDWSQWEKEIDFLALMGVNFPLVPIGHEGVWYLTLTQIGLSDEQARSFLCAPCFAPWQYMANIESWAGPLPMSWIRSHVALGKKVIARMIELGMDPFVPGFTGYVPLELSEKFPEANITEKEVWYGLNSKTAQLDPQDPLFSRIAKLFVENTQRLIGDVHWYACDVFHESSPPSREPNYLKSVGETLINSLVEADPKARIAMQTWTPYEDVIRAIPKDKIILLDLDSRRQSYWGYPFITGIIHNFGGRNVLGGSLGRSFDLANYATSDALDNCQGIGVFCEGSRNNSPIYMAAWEGIWGGFEDQNHQGRVDWIRQWATSRYSLEEGPAIDVWEESLKTFHAGSGNGMGETPLCARPSLSGTVVAPAFGGYGRPYPITDLWRIWEQLLQNSDALGSLQTYQYDVVDWGRQALADLAVILQKRMNKSYKQGKVEEFEKDSALFLKIGRDLDRLADTNSEFRLGTWIHEARRWGETPAEKQLLERAARILVTTWGPVTTAAVNFDYANRQWSGLMKDYYLVRWERYINFLKQEIVKPADERLDESKLKMSYGRPRMDNVFFEDLAEFEWDWADQCLGSYSPEPRGDSIKIAKEILATYSPMLKKLISLEGMFSLPDGAIYIGEWSPDTIDGNWVKKKWAINKIEFHPGTYEITVLYDRGHHRLDVREVSLLSNGKVISQDKHDGYTGATHEANVYTVKYEVGENLELEVDCKSTGGVNSYGIIYATRVGN